MKDNTEQQIKKLQELQEKAEEAAKSMKFQGMELRLVDDDGKVLVKGGMKVSDILMIGIDNKNIGEALNMLYLVLIDELEEKQKNQNKK